MPALRIGKDFCCVFFLFSFRMMSGYLQLFSVHICSNVTDYSLIFYIQRVKEFCRHQLLTRCMCVWGGHSFVCILFRVIATPCTSRSIYHRTDNCFYFCVSASTIFMQLQVRFSNVEFNKRVCFFIIKQTNPTRSNCSSI